MTFLPSEPRGEDGFAKGTDLYDRAAAAGTKGIPHENSQPEPEVKYLDLISQAETQGGRFLQDQVRKAWDRSYRAFRNQHFGESKYLSKEYRARSKLFRPKTRAAVRKANAAAATALFSTMDTVSCSPGNESDPIQKASASLIQEILNYRTDRTSGKASFPWFRIAIGAHQDAQIMSVCLSKQYWKLELESEEVEEPLVDEATGMPTRPKPATPARPSRRVMNASISAPASAKDRYLLRRRQCSAMLRRS